MAAHRRFSDLGLFSFLSDLLPGKAAAERPLFEFQGGVKPATHKDESTQLPIGIAPLVPRYRVPLHQSLGGAPRPLVKVGERVAKGQGIGAADGWVSAAIHAPTSGTVTAIAEFPQAHPSGLAALCVEIEADGADTWADLHDRGEHPGARHRLAPGSSPDAVRRYLQDMGVVGLGGAVFPSHAKLSASRERAMDEVVINGAECEPFITCDDLLMRERAEDILRGALLFRELLEARRVIVGVEDNKPEALAALGAAATALGVADLEIVAVPTRYPTGGAKELIRVLTGKEVPGNRRSTDLGVQCFNAATAYTAWRAVAHAEPVIGRVVTLSGHVETPRNWEVRLGTPIEALLTLGGEKPGRTGLIMGGPMMGFILPHEEAPVIKATNCLIAHSPTSFPPRPAELPCIRCGSCARACPHELQPFELYWWSRARNFGKAQEYALFDCIECGCCDFVCPSHIPLVQYFRFAKGEIWAREKEKTASESAKERFEFRKLRAEREKAEKAEKLARAAAQQAARAAVAAPEAPKTPETPGTEGANPAPADPDAAALAAKAARAAAIAAAMERAKAQRAAVTPRNTETLSAEVRQEIAEIDARRAGHDAPGNNEGPSNE